MWHKVFELEIMCMLLLFPTAKHTVLIWYPCHKFERQWMHLCWHSSHQYNMYNLPQPWFPQRPIGQWSKWDRSNAQQCVSCIFSIPKVKGTAIHTWCQATRKLFILTPSIHCTLLNLHQWKLTLLLQMAGWWSRSWFPCIQYEPVSRGLQLFSDS